MNASASRFWYHGWTIVAAAVLSQIATNGLTHNAFSLFLPGWSAELHSPVSKLQLPVGVMAFVFAIISPVVGALADKYTARPLLTLGLVGMGVFYLAIGSVTETWQIIALYGLVAPWALCLSTAVVVNALISRWFVRRLGLALGLCSFGFGMAGVFLSPLIAWLLPEVGWRMIWRGGALVLIAVVMPLVVWASRNRPTEAEGAYYMSSDGKPVKAHGHGGGTAAGLSWREVASRRNFWLLVAIYLPMMAAYAGVGQNLAPFAVRHGLGPQAGGLLLSVLSTSHLVATLLLGLASDRYGNRLPFAVLAAVMVLGATLLSFGSSVPVLTLGCVLIGCGGGWTTLLAAGIAVEFGAEGMGRAFGLAMLFIPAGAFVPFGVARLQESTGSYAPPLMGLAATIAVSGFLALLLRERPRGEATAENELAAQPDASA